MRTRFPIKFIFTASILAITAFGAGGCSSLVKNEITGSVGANTAPQTDADWQKALDVYGERYRADPKNAEAALRYGQALRATGQRAQATAVLEQAAIINPSDRALIAAYGRALVDNGKYQQGFDTLSRAHSPENPDWHILSVQGTALDRLGRHDDARQYYGNALKIKPDEPSVLSNLGMSYVLSKQPAVAEQVLRRARDGAPSDLRIRQNLALAVGLQGRMSEAETIVATGLPADEAAESVSQLKQMLNRGGLPRPPGGRAARGRETDHTSRS
jgi:Flp pilus assembly protein TadD